MEWGLFPLQIAFQNGDGAPTEPASGLAYLAASRDDVLMAAAGDVARSGEWPMVLADYVRQGGTVVVYSEAGRNLPSWLLGVRP